MSVETVISVFIGGLITLLVSWIFNWFSSRKLDRVARQLDDQTGLLRSENEKLRNISKGIIMALEKPGEFEPIYNEDDGSFEGWHVTEKLYTEVISVDKHGIRLDIPRYKRWWQKLFGARPL